MNDTRWATMSDEQLGRAITRLGGQLAWPATPPVSSGTVEAIRRIESAPRSLTTPRLSLPSRRRTILLIAAALLVIAGAAVAARLVIELGAIAVEVVPGRPTALPTEVATGSDLGREVSPEEARRIAGFELAVPTALGPPDRVWVDETEVAFEPTLTAVRVVSAWPAGAGLPEIPRTGTGALLMQFEGDWEVASKQVSAETNRFGEAVVDGRAAFWTTGEHQLTLVRGDEARSLLVTGNVLIWQEDGFTFRLETALPKRQAIAIAGSVVPAVDPA